MEGVASQQTKHIEKMISRQQNKKGGGGGGPRLRKGGGGQGFFPNYSGGAGSYGACVDCVLETADSAIAKPIVPAELCVRTALAASLKAPWRGDCGMARRVVLREALRGGHGWGERRFGENLVVAVVGRSGAELRTCWRKSR